jgi:prevent-host-death family protein
MEKGVAEASRDLSKLIEAAERGENVVITRRRKHIVQIVRIKGNKRRPLGFFRDKSPRNRSELVAPDER